MVNPMLFIFSQDMAHIRLPKRCHSPLVTKVLKSPFSFFTTKFNWKQRNFLWFLHKEMVRRALQPFIGVTIGHWWDRWEPRIIWVIVNTFITCAVLIFTVLWEHQWYERDNFCRHYIIVPCFRSILTLKTVTIIHLMWMQIPFIVLLDPIGPLKKRNWRLKREYLKEAVKCWGSSLSWFVFLHTGIWWQTHSAE